MHTHCILSVVLCFATALDVAALASNLSSSTAHGSGGKKREDSTRVVLWMWDRSENEWSFVLVDFVSDLTKRGIIKKVEKGAKYEQHLEKYCPTTATMYYPRPGRAILHRVLEEQYEGNIPEFTKRLEKDEATQVYRPVKDCPSMSSLSVGMSSDLLLGSDTIPPKVFRTNPLWENVVCTKDPIMGVVQMHEWVKMKSAIAQRMKDLTFTLRKGQNLKGKLTESKGSNVFSTEIYLPLDPMLIDLNVPTQQRPGADPPVEAKTAVKVYKGSDSTVNEVELQEEVKIALPSNYFVGPVRRLERDGKSKYQMLCKLHIKSDNLV